MLAMRCMLLWHPNYRYEYAINALGDVEEAWVESADARSPQPRRKRSPARRSKHRESAIPEE
jgi:hypothetical protein